MESVKRVRGPTPENPVTVKIAKGLVIHMGVFHANPKGVVHDKLLLSAGLSDADRQAWTRKKILSAVVDAGIAVRKYTILFPKELTSKQCIDIGNGLGKRLIDRGNGFVEFAVFEHKGMCIRVLTSELKISADSVSLPENGAMDEQAAQAELRDVCDYRAKLLEELTPSDDDASRASDESH